MTTLRFAIQAALLALVGMAFLQIILRLREPTPGPGLAQARVETGSALVPLPPTSEPRTSYAKGVLTLPMSVLSPAPSGSWVEGVTHVVLHAVFVPGETLAPFALCVWSQGTLESLRETHVRLRVQEKPRPSRLEAYAHQKGLQFRIFMQNHAELQTKLGFSGRLLPCRRWRHIPESEQKTTTLVLQEGSSKVLSGDDIVSFVRVQGSAAIAVQDVFSSALRLEAIEPGVAQFQLERLPGPRKEVVQVRVQPRLSRQPRFPKRQAAEPRATPRQGVFLVPGWSPPNHSGKKLP